MGVFRIQTVLQPCPVTNKTESVERLGDLPKKEKGSVPYQQNATECTVELGGLSDYIMEMSAVYIFTIVLYELVYYTV